MPTEPSSQTNQVKIAAVILYVLAAIVALVHFKLPTVISMAVGNGAAGVPLWSTVLWTLFVLSALWLFAVASSVPAGIEPKPRG